MRVGAMRMLKQSALVQQLAVWEHYKSSCHAATAESTRLTASPVLLDSDRVLLVLTSESPGAKRKAQHCIVKGHSLIRNDWFEAIRLALNIRRSQNSEPQEKRNARS